MVIAVASGKGGTGKTTVAVNLSLLIENSQYIDCDVEEPNGHIFLKPKIERSVEFCLPVPKIDEDRCIKCGRCTEVCEYHALVLIKDKVLFFPELCHGCGACSYFCEQGAIEEVGKAIGVIEIGRSENIDFAQGKLKVGEAVATPLIRELKRYIKKDRTVILDAPPGTSCPVIETVKGVDFVILVTEPTPFGMHDFILAKGVVEKLSIPYGVVINVCDIGDRKIFDYCEKEGIPILSKIPFSKEIAEAYSKGEPIFGNLKSYEKLFFNIFEGVKNETDKYNKRKRGNW